MTDQSHASIILTDQSHVTDRGQNESEECSSGWSPEGQQFSAGNQQVSVSVMREITSADHNPRLQSTIIYNNFTQPPGSSLGVIVIIVSTSTCKIIVWYNCAAAENDVGLGFHHDLVHLSSFIASFASNWNQETRD